ncbi:hypothetical protein FDJ19_gp189 [Vibrio phage Ceto]|uniref:Uncharacterized protein n=1 Tax=Vibrio phage Ceto TaxID=2570300 RepID=A0A2H5BGL9_9CAUD|nr:hypothetical protein FDJ19_gp189 [Vibrio phage Ceto]AUG85109.1 hypothetical protein CETO_122 [Vibrio phage Ceto]
MAIPSAKELTQRIALDNAGKALEAEKALEVAFKRVESIPRNGVFDISVGLGSTHKAVMEELLRKAGYHLISIHFSTWRNEPSAQIRLQIPPQAE